MHLVISTSAQRPSLYEQYFLKNVLAEWLVTHQDCQFSIIYFKKPKEVLPAYKNLQEHYLSVSPSLPLYEWRRSKKLKSLLDDISASSLLSFETILWKRKTIPQHVIVSRNPQKNAKQLKLAKTIITSSLAVKKELKEGYAIQGDKTIVVYGGSEKKPLGNEEEKIWIKEQYTEGKEYFLTLFESLTEDFFVQLLKAFSIFKKRQKTSMRLVLLIRSYDRTERIETLLKTYKYKEEIILADKKGQEEQDRLISGAYAVIYIAGGSSDTLTELDILKTGAPLLSTNESVLKEISNEGALYFNFGDTADIADKMMLIYKDEMLRGKLISDGAALTAQYTWSAAAATLWQLMN